jgi:hypothetical protein
LRSREFEEGETLNALSSGIASYFARFFVFREHNNIIRVMESVWAKRPVDLVLCQNTNTASIDFDFKDVNPGGRVESFHVKVTITPKETK